MSLEYSADVVAQSFIKQFYEKLAKNPADLHRFYKEESLFSHSEDETSTPTYAVKGLDAIRDKVSALNFGGARVDLTDGSVDAQRSDGDGVLVMVTGDFSKPGHESRRFVQSFFLASQTIGPNVTYFVRNSAFRLLGPSALGGANVSAGTGAAKVASTSASTQAGAGNATVHTSDASTGTPAKAMASVATSTSTDTAASAAAPKAPNGNKPAADKAPAHVEHAKAAVADAAEAEAEHAATSISAAAAHKSYSDMVRQWTDARAGASAGGAATTAAAGSASAARKPATSAPRPVSSSSETAAPKAAGSEAPSHGIYVKQLPATVTDASLTEFFSRFGAVKRTDLNPSRSFAFVDFDTAAAVKAAVEAAANGGLEFAGSVLKVEERNQRSSSAAGSGRRGSGSGAGNGNGGNNGSGSGAKGRRDGSDRRDGSNGKENRDRDRDTKDKDRRQRSEGSGAGAGGKSSGQPRSQGQSQSQGQNSNNGARK